MGVNQQTSVPAFTSGQVLTAQQQTEINTGVPVFAGTTERDAAFGGAGEKVLAEGQLCYLESTNKVQYYDGSAWANLGSMTQVTAFSASGTFTVPAGVTYAIAHIRAGGGSTGTGAASSGGSSSVAFASGTVTANGGNGLRMIYEETDYHATGATNSGQGGASMVSNGGLSYDYQRAQDGAYIVAGAAVTPAASITVTVGAGEAARTGGAAGGSGYVWIEYQV